MEHLQSYIRKELEKIPLPKVQQLDSLENLNVYRLLLKEEGMLHSSKHGPIPHPFEMCYTFFIVNKIFVYEICKSMHDETGITE